MIENDLVVVSFYTNNWQYPKLAAQLRQCCIKLGLRHDIQEVEDTGDWFKNTCLKAHYIKDMLLKHGHILWIDADAHLKRLPTAVFNQKTDFLLCKNTHMRSRLYQVGVMAILSNERTLAFIDDWILACDALEGTDEKNFDLVMRDYKKDNKLSVSLLPQIYHYVKETDPAFLAANYIIRIGISKDSRKMKTKTNNRRKDE